jgi:tRNA (guanine37-N1)-methyltransferase
MRFDIVTLFPEFFRGPFDHGILERALRSGLAEVKTHDLRDFTHDRHRTVDDRPFGGGEGMVLKPQPIFECLESLQMAGKGHRSPSERVILLSAQGRPFTQHTARTLASLDRIVLICGRYEGVDERVSQQLCDQELSIGDYVLSGGELAAAVIVDSVVRLLPGVLGHADSSRYESFGEGDTVETCRNQEASDDSARGDNVPRATSASGGLLDYPHYTRPAEWQGLAVPEALSGGDHLAVRRWRRHAALAKTLANRPDLLAGAELSGDDREYLAGLGFTRPDLRD